MFKENIKECKINFDEFVIAKLNDHTFLQTFSFDLLINAIKQSALNEFNVSLHFNSYNGTVVRSEVIKSHVKNSGLSLYGDGYNLIYLNDCFSYYNNSLTDDIMICEHFHEYSIEGFLVTIFCNNMTRDIGQKQGLYSDIQRQMILSDECTDATRVFLETTPEDIDICFNLIPDFSFNSE